MIYRIIIILTSKKKINLGGVKMPVSEFSLLEVQVFVDSLQLFLPVFPQAKGSMTAAHTLSPYAGDEGGLAVQVRAHRENGNFRHHCKIREKSMLGCN